MESQTIITAAAAIVALIALLGVFWVLRVLRHLRAAADRQVTLLQQQVRLLERQGQVQGWLPPQGTEPWRPPHLQR